MHIKKQKSSVLSSFVEYFSLLAPNWIVRLSIPYGTLIANTLGLTSIARTLQLTSISGLSDIRI